MDNSTIDQSGPYVEQINQMIRFADNSRTVDERLLWLSFVTQYLSCLIAWGKPWELQSPASKSDDAFIIVQRLLGRTSPVRDTVCRWLRMVVANAKGNREKEAALVVGLTAPILEPPIKWNDRYALFQINAILELLDDRQTAWAVASAYEENYETEITDKIAGDLERVAEWRATQMLPEIDVNWPAVETWLSSP